MDKKIYEKTRYQNIYRHIKNKNYVIDISTPVKTSISRFEDKRIFDIEVAKKIRDNEKIRKQKDIEIKHKELFDSLWEKYIYYLKYDLKLQYNTINRKQKDYNRYLKEKITTPISKTNKNFWISFIEKLDCSLKQKNHIIKQLKAFFNWLYKEEYIIINPVKNINKYDVPKTQMKYWIPEQLKQFLNTIRVDMESEDSRISFKAWIIYILTIVTFSCGDRIGETRALSFSSFHKDTCKLDIFHSIEYDPSATEFVKGTKNKESERTIDITNNLIEEVEKYRIYLSTFYDIKDNSLLFFNYKNAKPYSDTILRKYFYYYCEKANVPKIRMYDLRHTFAATMMAEGKEAYLFSKRMGHKKINTTIDFYGHLSEKIKKEVASSTDKYL